MFDRINATQHACYLEALPWDQLLPLAKHWVGDALEILQQKDPTLEMKGSTGRFRVERFALHPERQPWSYLITFTQAKVATPLDPWQQVHFAQRIALQAQVAAYCDMPPELGQTDPGFYWQLKVSPAAQEVQFHIARCEEWGDDGIRLIDLTPVDLRNFELYQLFRS